MTTIKLILTFFILVSGLIPGFAQSNEADQIRSILQERDHEIKELIGPENTEYTEDQRQQLRSIINDMMDYREMGRHALDEKFSELDTDQQDEFIELFTKIIRDQSLQQLDIYRAEVNYEDIQVSEDTAKVITTAILDERRIPVNYRMKKKEGEWFITDMSVDSAWTAESYQRSFQNIIRRRGFDALLESLRKRAGQIS